MSLLQLSIVALIAMTGLVIMRSVRARAGRTPFPEGNGRRLLILAFLVVPPLALSELLAPAAGPVSAVAAVPLYVLALAVLAALMAILVLVVGFVAPTRSHRDLRIALTGTAGSVDDVARNPPLTALLAENVALVDRNNAAFPRGTEFPTQVDRPDFRVAWDALNASTMTLEGHIADDHKIGQPVAAAATATAADARSRLTTLRRMAIGRGQVWAPS